jgi:hypothetical protein
MDGKVLFLGRWARSLQSIRLSFMDDFKFFALSTFQF